MREVITSEEKVDIEKFDINKIYVYGHYKLHYHKDSNTWYFVSLSDSVHSSPGYDVEPKEHIKKVRNKGNRVYELDSVAGLADYIKNNLDC